MATFEQQQNGLVPLYPNRADGTFLETLNGLDGDINIIGGTDITVTTMDGDITITNDRAISFVSAGGDESIVAGDLSLKGLTAGTAIGLTGAPTDVTIEIPAADRLSITDDGESSSLIKTGIGNPLELRGIQGGPGVTVVNNIDEMRITSNPLTRAYAGGRGTSETISAGTGRRATCPNGVLYDSSLLTLTDAPGGGVINNVAGREIMVKVHWGATLRVFGGGNTTVTMEPRVNAAPVAGAAQTAAVNDYGVVQFDTVKFSFIVTIPTAGAMELVLTENGGTGDITIDISWLTIDEL